MNCDSDSSISACGSDDDDVSADECTWKKLAAADDDDDDSSVVNGVKRSSERKRRDEDVLAVEAVVGFSARNPWLSRAFISIRVRLYFARDDDDAACPVQISIGADRPIDSQGMQAFQPRYHAHHETCYRFSFL